MESARRRVVSRLRVAIRMERKLQNTDDTFVETLRRQRGLGLSDARVVYFKQ